MSDFRDRFEKQLLTAFDRTRSNTMNLIRLVSPPEAAMEPQRGWVYEVVEDRTIRAVCIADGSPILTEFLVTLRFGDSEHFEPLPLDKFREWIYPHIEDGNNVHVQEAAARLYARAGEALGLTEAVA